MKNSKFWRLMALAAVVGLFLNAAALWNARGTDPFVRSSNAAGSIPALPIMDMFASSAYGQAPLVEKFDEQGQSFLRVWNTDEKGNLHYRVLRWQSGALQSKMTPDLIQHIMFDTAGKMMVLLQKA